MHLLRWIRCILNREFLLADAILLWDAIFSCANVAIENKNTEFTGRLDPKKEFLLLDFLCVAMLVFVRGFLLESDANGCLMRLLKFPPVENITELVSMAVRYRDYILGGCSSAKPNLQPTRDAPLTRSSTDPLPAPEAAAPVAARPVADPLSRPVADPLSRPAARKPVLIKETKTLTTNESPVPAGVAKPMTDLSDVITML